MRHEPSIAEDIHQRIIKEKDDDANPTTGIQTH
jgi:hypothetical protein